MNEISCDRCHHRQFTLAEAKIHKLNTGHKMTEFCWLLGSRREFMKEVTC